MPKWNVHFAVVSAHKYAFFIGIYRILWLWFSPAPVRSKVVFWFAPLVVNPWLQPTLWSDWHDLANCFARQIPKHTTSVWDQDHHQAFLWPAKTVAKPSLSYATNGLCIECLSPQNQAFSWRLLFSQTHVCCASHETFQHEVCFEYTINHYQPLSSTMNLHEPSLTTISHW